MRGSITPVCFLKFINHFLITIQEFVQWCVIELSALMGVFYCTDSTVAISRIRLLS